MTVQQEPEVLSPSMGAAPETEATRGGRRGRPVPLEAEAPELGWWLRTLRRLRPTKLWNTRTEQFVYGAENLLRRGTSDFFQVVEVESTTACNRRCSYCPNAHHERGLLKNEQRMGDDLFERLLGQLADLRFAGRISPHFYGEPLLDERLESWIARCRGKLPLAKIVVFTNGDYLDVARYQSLVRAGLDGLLVTQHSAKPLRGVEAVLEHRRQHGAAGVRLDYRRFDADTELSNRGGLVEHDKLEVKTSCRIPAENVTIDHQGNVILCCNDYFSTVSFGNIGSEHLRDIWNKQSLRQLRRDLARGRFELDICKRCAAGANVGAASELSAARALPVLP